MKDKNWTDIVSKQGDLRHFASMAIRKSGKSEHASAQEIDFLFRIALSEEPLTPRQITSAMGISKTIVSRLTDHLESKGLSVKRPLRPTAAVTASALPVPEKMRLTVCTITIWIHSIHYRKI